MPFTKNFFYERKIPDVEITDTYKGIQISIQDIKFVADSSEILPEEKERIDAIYEELYRITKDNEFTIMVEGHTAPLADSTYALNNTITSGFHGVDNAICNLGYNVQSGFNTLGHQISDCCCATQRSIDGINYNMATQACDTRNLIQNTSVPGGTSGRTGTPFFDGRDKLEGSSDRNQGQQGSGKNHILASIRP